jgi:hypothetical protein
MRRAWTGRHRADDFRVAVTLSFQINKLIQLPANGRTKSSLFRLHEKECIEQQGETDSLLYLATRTRLTGYQCQ